MLRPDRLGRRYDTIAMLTASDDFEHRSTGCRLYRDALGLSAGAPSCLLGLSEVQGHEHSTLAPI